MFKHTHLRMHSRVCSHSWCWDTVYIEQYIYSFI